MNAARYRQIAGPAGADPARPRLLLVSYHFPPGPAVGGLRWLRFAQLAAESGWAMDVVTADPAGLSRSDEGRLADLPADTRVYGVLARGSRPNRAGRSPPASSPPAEAGEPVTEAPAATPSVIPTGELRWELGSLLGWRRMVRVGLHLHRERAWSTEAEAAGLHLSKGTPYDAIISSGPPHFAHLAAVAIARQTGRPAVLDFRDPWSAMRAVLFGVATPLWTHANRWLEHKALRQARLACFNTDLATEAMRARYPALADRFLTVMNGADEDPVPAAPPRTRFTISYAGNIYIDRNPRTLFLAVATVVQELALTPEHLSIEFMGHADRLDGRTVQEIAIETGVGEFFTQHAVGPRQDALRFLAKAAILVSLPQSTALAIPSKAFEYLAFEAWPLLLAGPESATARLFRGTTVPVVSPDDIAGIAAMVRDRYQRFASGERPGPVPEREQFSRRGQARILFQALGRVTNRLGALR